MFRSAQHDCEKHFDRLEPMVVCGVLIIQPSLLVYPRTGCSLLPLNFAQEQNRESPKHEVHCFFLE